MIKRIVAPCPSCERRIILRITVAGGRQPFVFACPYCTTELRATLVADLDKGYDFESDDLQVIPNDEEEPDDLAVAINTDLPVHRSLVGERAADAFRSPFIFITAFVAGDAVGDLTDRVHRMRSLREQAYPHLRRAAAAFARGDIANLQFILKRTPGGDNIDFTTENPVNVLGAAITSLYEPFEEADARIRAAKEWARTIGQARERDENAIRALYAELSPALLEHRARVIDTCMGGLGDPSALIPALWLEAIEARAPVNEFVVMRDDFDVLKGRYQDIFETASRSLAFTSRVANVAHRGDPKIHADGSSKTLHNALNKTTAYQREPWLSDFPQAKALYDRMKRHTRNDIGHRLVRYDFATGDLVFDDGASEPYIYFVIDYLQAVRLSHYLLDVCELFWHTNRMLTRNAV